MDIGFVLMYIVVPAVVGIGIVLGKKKDDKQRLGNTLLIKGGFYICCVVVNIINYTKDDRAIRYVIGWSIGLAIIEGIIALYDGYEQLALKFKEELL